MANLDESYKKLREAFVSDHYGGSVWEINQITLIAPVSFSMPLHGSILTLEFRLQSSSGLYSKHNKGFLSHIRP